MFFSRDFAGSSEKFLPANSRGAFIAGRPLPHPGRVLGVTSAAPAPRSDALNVAVDLGPRFGAWEWPRVA
jgi:hypothetical protein